MAKRKRRKKRLKKKYSIIFTIILIIVAFVCLDKALTNNQTLIDIQNKITEELNKKEIERKRLEEEERKKREQEENYNACLEEKYSEDNKTGEIALLMSDLSTYLKKYNCSVSYYDLNYGFEYSYNQNKVYYAASTIKMLDALYIYTKASVGEIDLDETVKYKSENQMGASKEMKKYKIGDKVSLRNLVKYAITVSDNTAHDMLIKYIGFKNLKAYGNNLGAKYTLVGGDNFGEINVSDAIIYLKELNKFIEENKELGTELQQYFLDSEQNYLDFPDLGIKAGQKYGEYSLYYHENGIVYSEYPYLVSILTLEGKKENIIRDINKHIYELHNNLYEAKKNNCYNKIYNDGDSSEEVN